MPIDLSIIGDPLKDADVVELIPVNALTGLPTGPVVKLIGTFQGANVQQGNELTQRRPAKGGKPNIEDKGPNLLRWNLRLRLDTDPRDILNPWATRKNCYSRMADLRKQLERNPDKSLKVFLVQKAEPINRADVTRICVGGITMDDSPGETHVMANIEFIEFQCAIWKP